MSSNKTISEMFSPSSAPDVLHLKKRHLDPKRKLIISDNNSPIKGYLTVYYYAEWCGHCKHSAPLILKASQTCTCFAKPSNTVSASKCRIAICERSKQNKTKQDRVDDEYLDDETFDNILGIQGFPTIQQYLNGKHHRTFEGNIDNPQQLLLFISGVDDYENANIVSTRRR